MTSPNFEVKHGPGCPARWPLPRECECGLVEMLDRAGDRQDATDQSAAGERRAAEEARYPLELLELLERIADALEGLADWHPMETAPKNRTSVLLLLRDDVSANRPDLEGWDGLQFVGRHPGLCDNGLDIGWNFAAPVGHGGFPDRWFVGWRPLPSAARRQRQKERE